MVLRCCWFYTKQALGILREVVGKYTGRGCYWFLYPCKDIQKVYVVFDLSDARDHSVEQTVKLNSVRLHTSMTFIRGKISNRLCDFKYLDNRYDSFGRIKPYKIRGPSPVPEISTQNRV